MKLNKKQKRTATIASMAALLAVVLGMGGQTFAKYITTNTVEADKAVVAKWGYVIQATSDNSKFAEQTAFKTSYNSNAILSSDTNVSVVAPGASGEVSIYVTGSPEVKSKLEFTFKCDVDVFVDSYYPIVWSITGTYTTEADTDETIEVNGLKASEIQNKLNTYGATFAANTSVVTSIKLSWAWAFGAEDNKVSGNDFDDTRLGDLATLTDEQYKTKYDVTSLPDHSTEIIYSFGATVYQVK
jgi:hypothetical protein